MFVVVAQIIEMTYGKLDNTEGFVIGGWVSHPASSGQLRLRSNKPSDRPLIQPNYLKERQDIKIMVEGKNTQLYFTMQFLFTLRVGHSRA